jgi:hypothetical protein
MNKTTGMSATRRTLARTGYACLAVFLVSCAGMQTRRAQAYPGAARPLAEVATLVRSDAGPSGPPGFPEAVDGVNYDDHWTGRSVVEILPGNHTIIVGCSFDNLSSHPSVTGTFKAGHFYLTGCVVQGKYARASIQDFGMEPPKWVSPRPPTPEASK